MIEYVTARFPENRKERVTKRRAMVDRLHTFIPPDSRMRLRLIGETFGRWRRERDGVARVLEILDRSEVGQKLVVQRESDREQLSVRQVETLFIPDLAAHPMIELLSAELVEKLAPAAFIESLEHMAQSDREGWKIYGWREDARTILSAVIAGGDSEARAAAVGLVHRLGARGFQEFRDLLPGA